MLFFFFSNLNENNKIILLLHLVIKLKYNYFLVSSFKREFPIMFPFFVMIKRFHENIVNGKGIKQPEWWLYISIIKDKSIDPRFGCYFNSDNTRIYCKPNLLQFFNFETWDVFKFYTVKSEDIISPKQFVR